ncbi:MULTISPECIES: ArsR/SmtB family transcription factor [unclassified Amycolatopsis]|uniref:ArsR/SmtB family transcription factor n=1 Tax=unclassified Amycolatopsis TaxID=2618356 RepID=UPI002E0F1063|nr:MULTISPECIES: helix-turn-helix domain-containing protein [unclassified Amycolatopsis]WSK81915.1 helix-turn-helix domain-containing protein [Amycolatopsis sp. NBC_01286]
MSDEVRNIRDSKVLAAVSHPLRRRLMELLHLDGPATASMLAGKTDQAVGNISHHMKVLAAAKLVEEAPELARDQRERWWKRTVKTIRWAAEDFPGDPIAEAAEVLTLDHQTAIAREWIANRETYPEPWRGSAFSTDTWMRLSVADLEELNERVLLLLTEFESRTEPGDGVERRPVFFAARVSLGKP